MIKIAICDDEKKNLEETWSQLMTAAESLGLECTCDLYTDARCLLKKLENETVNYDIALLDIYIGKNSGIQAGRQLAERSPETAIVFVTVSQTHAVDAFSLDALHYLVKPVDDVQMKSMLERYLKRSAKKRSLEIRVGRDHLKLSLDSILYLESARNGTDIHTAGGMLHTTVPTSTLEKQLGEDFLKIQRGFIVNMHFIERMTSDSCVLKNGFTALLSRKDKKKIRTAYREFIFNVAGGGEDL